MSSTTLKHISVEGKKKEILYEKITDTQEINEIESKKGYKWKPLPSTLCGYYVFIQENLSKEKTGYIRIAKREKVTVVGFPRSFKVEDKSDYAYFKKFKKRTV